MVAEADFASRLVLRIQERQARLTPSERKIADILLRDHLFVETHMATELARTAGVSKATTARFFRTLGYADFEEVRLQARDERNRKQPYRAVGPSTPAPGMGRTIGDHLGLELTNLTRTFEELRPDVLSDVAALLTSAPRVWLLGFGAEDGAARLGQAVLSRYRHEVHQLTGHGEEWSRALATMGPRDVLLVLTLEPRPRLMRTIVGYARTSRVRIVTLTDHGYREQAERFSEFALPAISPATGRSRRTQRSRRCYG